jgi:hypothetical protein
VQEIGALQQISHMQAPHIDPIPGEKMDMGIIHLGQQKPFF